MYTVHLMVGDWADDGHGKTEVVAVKSSLSSEELEEAYMRGVAVMGINATEQLCRAYEDSSIPEETFQKFLSLYPRLEEVDPYLNEPYRSEDDEDERGISPIIFAALYMITCAQGHPELQWEFTDSDVINIGGYGLFV